MIQFIQGFARGVSTEVNPGLVLVDASLFAAVESGEVVPDFVQLEGVVNALAAQVDDLVGAVGTEFGAGLEVGDAEAV